MGPMLQDLAVVDRVREEERQWIAAELHDGLLQDVVGAKMQLESLLSSGQVPPGSVRDSLVHAIELLQNASSEARAVVQGLLPPIFEDKGLIGAIKSFLAMRSNAKIDVRFKADVAFRRLEPSLETGIYRIIHEAVTNIRQHSRAERAEVRIAQVADRIEIVIRDSGVGFDPALVSDTCFGLKGIRERAGLLGGSAQVDSLPGKGTRISVRLPLSSSQGNSFTTRDRSNS